MRLKRSRLRLQSESTTRNASFSRLTALMSLNGARTFSRNPTASGSVPMTKFIPPIPLITLYENFRLTANCGRPSALSISPGHPEDRLMNRHALSFQHLERCTSLMATDNRAYTGMTADGEVIVSWGAPGTGTWRIQPATRCHCRPQRSRLHS